MRPDRRSATGDIEDDASSTKQRTLISLAGSLLAEISLPKLFAAWAILIVLIVAAYLATSIRYCSCSEP